MYDIKQVTRYVLVRNGDTDIAEFKRRDEAVAVLKALNREEAHITPAGIRGTTAQQDAARTVFHDGVCIKDNYGMANKAAFEAGRAAAQAIIAAPTEYDF